MVTLTAAAGFAVVLALARQGHPATGTSSTGSVSQPSGSSSSSLNRDDGSELDDSQLGGGSLAPPSGGSPPAATHTS